MAVVEGALLTWSNALTVSRLVAAPFFSCALLGDAPGIAALLFWGAVATDVADGRIARARGESTPLGGLLDHATDASFVSLGLAALAIEGVLTGWLPILVLAAFVQYVFDSRSLSGQALRASFLGRWNGILYFVPLGTIATRDFLGLTWPGDDWVGLCASALVVSTLLSMGDRAWALLVPSGPSSRDPD